MNALSRLQMLRKEEENSLAAEYGFEAIPDNYRGYGYCKFEKKMQNHKIHIWECIRSGSTKWARAVASNGRYRDHSYHDSLLEALQS
jgi:hypothetical protein